MLQPYESETGNEYVIRGNSALLKCDIASYMADLVYTESWIDSQGGVYTAHSNGKFNRRPPDGERERGSFSIDLIDAQDEQHLLCCFRLLLVGRPINSIASPHPLPVAPVQWSFRRKLCESTTRWFFVETAPCSSAPCRPTWPISSPSTPGWTIVAE